jgi:hypothetical protein
MTTRHRTLLALTLGLAGCSPGSSHEGSHEGSYFGYVAVASGEYDVNVRAADGCAPCGNDVPTPGGCVENSDGVPGCSSCTPCITSVRLSHDGVTVAEWMPDAISGGRRRGNHAVPAGARLDVEVIGCHGDASYSVEVPVASGVTVAAPTASEPASSLITWSPANADQSVMVSGGTGFVEVICRGPDTGSLELPIAAESLWSVRVDRHREVGDHVDEATGVARYVYDRGGWTAD